jgi:hypothetical protein
MAMRRWRYVDGLALHKQRAWPNTAITRSVEFALRRRTERPLRQGAIICHSCAAVHLIAIKANFGRDGASKR